MADLALRFTRLSPTHHRLEYRRPDGTGEAIEMETEGLLFHDLLHFALESEAGLRGSFYGVLAKIGGYEELRVAGGMALGGEIAITERVAGAITGAIGREDPDADGFLHQVSEFLEVYDEGAPRWVTRDFILAVRERMRQLEECWKATPFGVALELAFPL